jgi:hypothetical protein
MFFVNITDCDKWQRWEGDFSRAVNSTRASEAREVLHRANAVYHRLCDPSCGIRAVQGNVVADPFEIVCGVCRPADAHQPR